MPRKPKANLGPSAGPANRAALVAAARVVFAEQGFAAPLSAVSRLAGVGQGSLYRHFPDRISLAVAVFDDNVAALEALAAQPSATLMDLFHSVAEQALGSTALIDMLSSGHDDERARNLADRVTAVARTLLEQDQLQGLVAARLETADVMLSISMLAFLMSRTPQDERPEAAARAEEIFRRAFAPAAG